MMDDLAGSTLNFWLSEIDAVDKCDLSLEKHFSNRSISIMMLVALQRDKRLFINKVLDYKDIPNIGLSYKQRLALYQLGV